MSPLTKVFVVLLVVLSLLLAAASITFLYTIPNFNAQIATLTSSLEQARANEQRISAAADASRSAAEQRAAELQNLLSDANASVAALRGELGKAQAESTDLRNQMAVLNTTQTTLSQAVNANMALVNTLRNELAQLREQYQRTLDQNLELNTALARTSNELEFTERALRQALEQNKNLLDQNNTYTAALMELGKDPRTLTGQDLAAPPINGVVVQRMSFDGEPFALISVGSEDDVKRGMRFMVIDRETSSFLGYVTIEEVDDQVSVGKLSGPRVEQIAPDDEVRTQPA